MRTASATQLRVGALEEIVAVANTMTDTAPVRTLTSFIKSSELLSWPYRKTLS